MITLKIRAKNITKKFDDFTLFENLCLDIQEGDFVGIYGGSGSGKTTLLNILGLIEKYDIGVIEYNGVPILKNSARRKILAEEVGFVFQNYALITNKSIEYNFKYIKKGKYSIKEVLEFVGLGYVSLSRKVFTLSGGEQQRVALAKVLYKEAKVILADEPTASVDDYNKNIIMDIFKRMNDNDVTIVFVTHDVSLKSYFSNTIYLDDYKKRKGEHLK